MLQRLGNGLGQKGSTLNRDAPAESSARVGNCSCVFRFFACKPPEKIAARVTRKQIPRRAKANRHPCLLLFTRPPLERIQRSPDNSHSDTLSTIFAMHSRSDRNRESSLDHCVRFLRTTS